MIPMIKRIQSLHMKGHPVSLRVTIDRVFVRRGDGGKLLVKWTYKGKQKGASEPVTVANGQGLVNESIDLQNLTMYPNQEKVVKFKLYEVVSSRGGEETKPIKVMEFLLDLSRTYYDSFHEKGLSRKEVLLDAADCPTALTVTVEVAPPCPTAPSSAASAPSAAVGGGGGPGSSFGIGIGGGGGTASGTLPGGVCSTLAPSDGNTPQESSMRDLFVTTSNVSGDGHLGVSVGAVSNGGGSGGGGDESPSAWKRRVSDLYKRNHVETGQKSQEEIDALLQCYQGDERNLYERLMQKYEPERAAAEAEAAAAEAEAEARGVVGAGGGGSGGSGGAGQQQPPAFSMLKTTTQSMESTLLLPHIREETSTHASSPQSHPQLSGDESSELSPISSPSRRSGYGSTGLVGHVAQKHRQQQQQAVAAAAAYAAAAQQQHHHNQQQAAAAAAAAAAHPPPYAGGGCDGSGTDTSRSGSGGEQQSASRSLLLQQPSRPVDNGSFSRNRGNTVLKTPTKDLSASGSSGFCDAQHPQGIGGEQQLHSSARSGGGAQATQQPRHDDGDDDGDDDDDDADAGGGALVASPAQSFRSHSTASPLLVSPAPSQSPSSSPPAPAPRTPATAVLGPVSTSAAAAATPSKAASFTLGPAAAGPFAVQSPATATGTATAPPSTGTRWVHSSPPGLDLAATTPQQAFAALTSAGPQASPLPAAAGGGGRSGAPHQTLFEPRAARTLSGRPKAASERVPTGFCAESVEEAFAVGESDDSDDDDEDAVAEPLDPADTLSGCFIRSRGSGGGGGGGSHAFALAASGRANSGSGQYGGLMYGNNNDIASGSPPPRVSMSSSVGSGSFPASAASTPPSRVLRAPASRSVFRSPALEPGGDPAQQQQQQRPQWERFKRTLSSSLLGTSGTGSSFDLSGSGRPRWEEVKRGGGGGGGGGGGAAAAAKPQPPTQQQQQQQQRVSWCEFQRSAAIPIGGGGGGGGPAAAPASAPTMMSFLSSSPRSGSGLVGGSGLSGSPVAAGKGGGEGGGGGGGGLWTGGGCTL